MLKKWWGFRGRINTSDYSLLSKFWKCKNSQPVQTNTVEHFFALVLLVSMIFLLFFLHYWDNIKKLRANVVLSLEQDLLAIISCSLLSEIERKHANNAKIKLTQKNCSTVYKIDTQCWCTWTLNPMCKTTIYILILTDNT